MVVPLPLEEGATPLPLTFRDVTRAFPDPEDSLASTLPNVLILSER